VVVTAKCLVEALADRLYTAGQACRIGYVKLNGRTVWESSLCSTEIGHHRGINILEIDPLGCTLSSTLTFDTFFAHACDALNVSLTKMAADTVVVGVTGGGPSLTECADKKCEILKKTFGVYTYIDNRWNIEFVDYMTSSLAFIAQKGQRTNTLFRFVVNRTESNRSPAHVNAAITGTQIAVKYTLLIYAFYDMSFSLDYYYCTVFVL